MADSRHKRVKAAIGAIRAFHELGRGLPKKRGHREVYGRGVIDAEAGRLGLNPDTVRKARQFADPAEGYTRTELDELCRLIRAVQPRQDQHLALFTRTHVVRLLSVPKAQRAALQEECVRGGWSTAELEAEIAKRYGARRAGGRRRRVPPDRAGLLTQIKGLCEQWRRWHAALGRQDDGSPARKKHLPDAVREQVEEVTAAVAGLRAAVEEAIRHGRQARGGEAGSRPSPA